MLITSVWASLPINWKWNQQCYSESDGISAELLKVGGKEVAKAINQQDLVYFIWLYKTHPDDWCIGLIIPLKKNGDQINCNNYCGITLKLHLQGPI